MTGDHPVRPFAAFLQEQRQGALHAELSEQLRELVTAVQQQQAGGSLTVTITVKPATDGLMLVVTDDVKAKVPQPTRGAALYFADDDGNLSRHNPNQPRLPLQEVAPPVLHDDAQEAAQ